MSGTLATREETTQTGPAMASLPTERMRAFARLMVDLPPCRGRQTRAVAEAGYEGKTRASLTAIGSRLAADGRVQEAISEYARARFGTLAGAAVASVEKLLSEPQNKNHLRAAALVVDKIMPSESKLTVEHRHHVSEADIARATEKIKELARQFGIAPLTAIVEGEVADGGAA